MTDGESTLSPAELRGHPATERWAARAVARLLPDRAGGIPAEEDAPASLTLGGVDVAEVLERGPASDAERELVSELFLLGLAAELTQERVASALAVALVRLSAAGPYDPLGAADGALGVRSEPLWRAVGEAIREGTLTPAEAGVALAALATARSPTARALAIELGERSRAGVLRRAATAALGPRTLTGELTGGPRPAFVTALAAISGWMFLAAAIRAITRLSLGLRRPAELAVTEQGLELAYRTMLLGRVVRERRIQVPRAGLARISREVRYRRLSLYAGLAALALGTYVGIGLFLDGLRVAGTSPSLLGLGTLAVLGGLVLDYALTWLSDLSRGRCRIVVIPQRGRAFAVSGLFPPDADALLRRLASLEFGSSVDSGLGSSVHAGLGPDSESHPASVARPSTTAPSPSPSPPPAEAEAAPAPPAVEEASAPPVPETVPLPDAGEGPTIERPSPVPPEPSRPSIPEGP